MMAAGKRIVLTRDAERNRLWAQRLDELAMPHLDLPLIRFEPLPLPSDLDPGGYDWILFTSPQGVRAYLESGLTTGTARLGALGTGTAEALRSAGLKADFDPGRKDGAAFARAFAAENACPGRILMPGPERRMTEPVAILAAAGFGVRELPLYRTVAAPPDELPADAFGPGDVVFFCSPSTVRAFAGAYQVRPDCVAIGETSAEAARAAGFDPAVAERPDLDAMLRAAGLDADSITSSPENES